MGWANAGFFSNPVQSIGAELSKADPSQTGKSNAVVTPGSAPVPQVQAPTQQSNLPQVSNVNVQQTQGPGSTNVDMSGVRGIQGQQAYTGQAGQAQNALMGQLAAQASGQGPSLASNQLQQGQQANLAQQMAMLASSRGQANPLAQRAAMDNAAASNATTNQQAANARIQEQMGAQQTLGAVANNVSNQGLTARGQDITTAGQQTGVAEQNAGQASQAQLAGYQGALQTNLVQAGINANQATTNAQLGSTYNQQGLGYAQLGEQAQGANQNAAIAGNQQALGASEANAGVSENNANNSQKAIGGIESGISSILGSAVSKGAKAATGAEIKDDGTFVPATQPIQVSGTNLYAKGTDAVPAPVNAPDGGGYIAGKAQIAGDSTKNDKVPVWVSPGEAIVPRTVMHAQDPVEAFRQFLGTMHQNPIGKSVPGEDHALHHVIMAQARSRKGA
jgi:hypothetical protein